jgi:hypothetical protein
MIEEKKKGRGRISKGSGIYFINKEIEKYSYGSPFFIENRIAY